MPDEKQRHPEQTGIATAAAAILGGILPGMMSRDATELPERAIRMAVNAAISLDRVAGRALHQRDEAQKRYDEAASKETAQGGEQH